MRKWTVLISSVTAASLCSLSLLVATTAGAASDDHGCQRETGYPASNRIGDDALIEGSGTYE